uniref:integrator complex subunit 7-like n=1 Tax=Callithrix jacchus TaxID=9483 RepID=UPI0023DD43A5|nr:integrator complex subunit 7-like [Callithrix jacchus]
MASNSTKSFLADAGYGEQELDTNSALMELDKGLRSGKLGEQCEAVVCFPRFFQKYPFPILINSAFLKLADVFRVGNNFLRLCVLKVTQQSEKHLEKILNVDEFVKRFFSVIHSNDPVARAITLRMLGSLASIIPERKNAHHSIRQSLDSHDNVEVEAAVFAAAIFSAQSKDFAVGICNKISEMIQGLATPVDLKLKLIPILQHMHHDAILASSARQLLQQLVTSYPSTKMVIVSLHTFTLLAASSLVDTPKQIQLLLQYLKNDPRKAVKRLAIQDLKLLANKTPHTWSKENIQWRMIQDGRSITARDCSSQSKRRELEDATLSDKFWSLMQQKIPSGGTTRVASVTLVAFTGHCIGILPSTYVERHDKKQLYETLLHLPLAS